MKRQERADYIRKVLEERFPKTPIPLDHKDAYTLLVAVLLSAQCTDRRVNTVTPHLFALADNPFTMAGQSEEKVQEIIRPCGLAPAKAKAIVNLSKILVEEHNGIVPVDLEALERLPGVGHKTASVVMVQAFGVPAFPVDTHIQRLAQRWELSSGHQVTAVEKSLKKLYPPESWAGLHLRIIFWGREICPARQCDGLRCEICKHCFPRRKNPVAIRK